MALSDQELISSLNYLGLPVSVPLQGAAGTAEAPAALPSVPTTAGGTTPAGVGGGPPAGVGEVQNQALRALTRSSAPSGTEAATGGVRRVTDAGTSNIADILGAAAQGSAKASDILKALPDSSPSHALDPQSRQAFEQQRAGERNVGAFPNFPIPTDVLSGASGGSPYFGAGDTLVPFDIPPDVLGGTSGGGAFGAEAPPGGFDFAGSAMPWVGAALGTGLSALAAANATNDWDRTQQSIHAALYGLGPVTGGITALAAGGMDALNAILGAAGAPSIGQVLGFAPSDEWMQFAPTLAQNLGTTQSAIIDLASGITAAESPEQLAQAAGNYRNRIASFAGGFGQGAGPYDIPGPPGATGTEHEGGLEMDFGGLMGPMQDLMTAKQAFLANPTQAGVDAQRAAITRINAELSRLAGLQRGRHVWRQPNMDPEFLAAHGLPADYGAVESGGGA